MDEKKAVADAVESLRKATVAGDGATLRQVLLDEVSFGHSNGRIETKADMLAVLDGKKAFRSITQSAETIEVVGDAARVRHIFDGERIQPDGSVKSSHLSVLQVWVKQAGAWRLFARHASAAA